MISIDKKNNVATLTFQRPEALNAFNEEMFDSVADALLNTAEEDDVKVLIITGAGRAFSAGLDLTSVGVKGAAPKHGRAEADEWDRRCRRRGGTGRG